MPNQVPNQPYTLYMSNFVNKITKFAENYQSGGNFTPPRFSRNLL